MTLPASEHELTHVNTDVVYELEDVEVERVDAVDRPATGRKWLLMKSEEEDETMLNVSHFEEIVRAALTQMKSEHDRGTLTLSEEAAAALNALAALVGESAELFQATAQRIEESKPVSEDLHDTQAPANADAVAESVTVEQEVQKAEEDGATQPQQETKEVEKQDEGYGYGYPDPQIFAMMLDELKAIHKLLADMVSKQAVQKASPPPSRQPEPAEKTARVPRWGEGLFADVVFGPRR